MDDLIRRARELHRQAQLIDGHNDLPWQYVLRVDGVLSKMDISQRQPQLQTDIPRLREGGVGGQLWGVFVPPALKREEIVPATVRQFDLTRNLIDRHPETFQLALTADQVEEAFRAGKIASVLSLEGGHSIGGSLAVLRMFYELGARCMTLTHFKTISWADSATDKPRSNGLSEFGREVVREMNRLGMLVDLSHVSPETMNDALDVTEAPSIFSHSSAKALTANPRNVPDDVLRRIPDNGGLVMASFVPFFVSKAASGYFEKVQLERERLEGLPETSPQSLAEGMTRWEAANPTPRATLAEVVDHIDYLCKTAGVDHVGIGSDFDGISSVPVGLEDVSKYPVLTAELIRRGYSDQDIVKIMGQNYLRVMRTAESIAKELQAKRGPSEARIEELDGAGASC